MKNARKTLSLLGSGDSQAAKQRGEVVETASVSGPTGLHSYAVKHYPLLSAKEEFELGKRKSEGDRSAFDALVNHNLRLSISIAYSRKSRGVPVDDLIQEGNLGLMKAAEKFDYRRGYRFSTYATWWVRQTIDYYILCQGKTIRVPAHMQRLCGAISQAFGELTSEEEGFPTPEEIAERIHVSPKRVKAALVHLNSSRMLSLDEEVFADADGSGVLRGDLLENRTYLDPDAALEARQELSYVIRRIQLIEDTVKEEMKERDFHIFRAFYQLDGREKCSLQEIAEEFGLQHYSVMPIIYGVWRKLWKFKKHFTKKAFESFLERIPDLEDLVGMQVEFN